DMQRRAFITLFAGAAIARPLAVRAQQTAVPVVGFVNVASRQGYERPLSSFLKGLRETGYVDGQNVVIEYRWAEGRSDRLSAMAADLVHDRVTVIAATSTPAALAAKAATAIIPIVFEMGGDPLRLGLVPSLNRPGGNITGVTQLNVEVAPKRLELLHELLPRATALALLINPANPTVSEPQSIGMLAAARTLGLELHVLNASTELDFDAAFEKFRELRAGGLVIEADPFFISRNDMLADLTVRHSVPAIFQFREFATAGGLMSYGGSLPEAYRLAGGYVGRILKGEKPADLPVQQATKVDLVINLKTAKTLGLTIPLPLLGRADEVIE
ncbi:MAG: ABC transporter substrate-binding protein, partial [Bradyrhizobium sp.]